jgi:hypothetical protein
MAQEDLNNRQWRLGGSNPNRLEGVPPSAAEGLRGPKNEVRQGNTPQHIQSRG